MRNLWDLAPKTQEEEVTILIDQSHVRIERIVSYGHSSPLDFFYDQEEAEWVSVLEGEAVLEFEDGSQQQLHRGDSVLLRAHQKHRVAATSDPCIWLCVFFQDEGSEV